MSRVTPPILLSITECDGGLSPCPYTMRRTWRRFRYLVASLPTNEGTVVGELAFEHDKEAVPVTRSRWPWVMLNMSPGAAHLGTFTG